MQARPKDGRARAFVGTNLELPIVLSILGAIVVGAVLTIGGIVEIVGLPILTRCLTTKSRAFHRAGWWAFAILAAYFLIGLWACSGTFRVTEDAAWIGGPYEGFWIGVGLGDEAVDSTLEVVDGSENSTLKPSTCEFGEQALDRIEPGCGRRCEVEGPAGTLGKPCAHLEMFMSGIVVDDGVDGLSLRHLRLDALEEADELLMAMAFHVVSDHGAVEDVKGGEQGRGAVTFIVVCHGPGAARLHRQTRLGTVEGLDLALFIDRKDDRMGGRVDIEPDNVLELFSELRIIRQLERADAWGASW